MYYIVTGAAGFIGSNIVKALNARGIHHILAVDDLSDGKKFRNLADCDIAHYMDKDDFMAAITNHTLPFRSIKALFHQGACADSMEQNGELMMANNYQYSLDVFDWCQDYRIPMIYASSASVYGDSNVFVEERQYEKPLTIYGYSKFLFDQVLRQRMNKGLRAPAVGLRYFNVYGVREQHKGQMASIPFHHFGQYLSRGYVELFGAYDGCEPGEQRRDFVSVEDVVQVNLFFSDHPELSGIFNLGTGNSISFNELAASAVNACRIHQGQKALTPAELVKEKLIRYIDFPDALKGKYQSFTQADISSLRAVDYTGHFLRAEEGVARYFEAFKTLTKGKFE